MSDAPPNHPVLMSKLAIHKSVALWRDERRGKVGKMRREKRAASAAPRKTIRIVSRLTVNVFLIKILPHFAISQLIIFNLNYNLCEEMNQSKTLYIRSNGKLLRASNREAMRHNKNVAFSHEQNCLLHYNCVYIYCTKQYNL